MEVTGRA